MIAFWPPQPMPRETVGWVHIGTAPTTATVVSVGETICLPDPPWFTIEVITPPTEFERELEAFRKRAALVRLWSRLAFKERARAVRRLRPRAPVGQPTLPLFARRTCSQASRWMVIQ